MVAESCGGVGAERSEAQHTATLAADSKTVADHSDAAALQKKAGYYTGFFYNIHSKIITPDRLRFSREF